MNIRYLAYIISTFSVILNKYFTFFLKFSYRLFNKLLNYRMGMKYGKLLAEFNFTYQNIVLQLTIQLPNIAI